MHGWSWLNANSGAVQSILAAVTILVLGFTAWAIKVQADAARALTRVAEEQTKAAVDAAKSSREQAELLARQFELTTAPLIVCEPDDRQNMRNCKIVNRGQGVAFQVIYWQGGLEARSQGVFGVSPVQPSTLAPGTSVYLPIPPGWESWTIRCKGSDRQERFTIMYRDPGKLQEHVVRQGLQEVYLS